MRKQLTDRFFVDGIAAHVITLGDARFHIYFEFAAAGYPTQAFLQQALTNEAYGPVGFTIPAHGAALQRVDDFVTAFVIDVGNLV